MSNESARWRAPVGLSLEEVSYSMEQIACCTPCCTFATGRIANTAPKRDPVRLVEGQHSNVEQSSWLSQGLCRVIRLNVFCGKIRSVWRGCPESGLL